MQATLAKTSSSTSSTLQTQPLSFSSFETRFGPFYVAYSHDEVVQSCDFQVSEMTFVDRCAAHGLGTPTHVSGAPAELSQHVRGTLAGDAIFQGRLAWERVPGFRQQVLRITKDIPWGAVRPYAWLAKEVGAPRASRAVGTSMATNPFPLLIPCHRVVRSDYTIGNYGCGGTSMKRALLEMEGVDIDDLAAAVRAKFRCHSDDGSTEFCLLGCSEQRGDPEKRRYFTSYAHAASNGLAPCSVCRPD